jgi:hypothetical protein
MPWRRGWKCIPFSNAPLPLWYATIEALSEFTSSFVSVTLAGAVGSQVSEFMCQPVSEGVIAQMVVAVDKHGSAGQVREHGTRISGWHVEAECSGRVDVLPVRHKDNSQRKNLGLHDACLSAYQYFLFRCGAQHRVAICGGFRCGCFLAAPACVPVCLPPAGLRNSE